jgi:hypothetical protein
MLSAGRRVAALVLTAALLVTLAGCNRGGGGEDKAAPPTKADRVRKMKYEAKATGALSFEATGTFDVRVLTIRSDEPSLASSTLLSVGPNLAVPLADGRTMRVAFDLLHFKGDGSYKIHAGAPSDLLSKAKGGYDPNTLDQSNVLVQVWPPGVDPKTQPQVFDRALEPCPVTVSKNGDSGHLHCPRMAAPDGGEFVLDMRWSLP